MGSIKLPKAQLTEFAPPPKRDPQTQAILSIGGNNPLAQGLNQIGPEIADALAYRAAARKKAQTIAELEKAGGFPAGSLSNQEPATAQALVLQKMKEQQDAAKQAAKDKQEQWSQNELQKVFTSPLSELANLYPSGVSKDKLSMIATIKNQQAADEDRDAYRKDISGRFQTKFGLDTTKAIQSESDRILNDDLLRSSIKSMETFGQAKTVFNQDLSVARGAMQSLANRTINKEVGASSEGDVQRATGSSDLANRYGAKIRLIYDGRATDQDYREFQTILKVIQDRSAEQYNKSMAVGIDSLTNAFGISPETAKIFLRYRPASTYVSEQQQAPVTEEKRNAPGIRPITPTKLKYSDAEKERRYQEWKKSQQ